MTNTMSFAMARFAYGAWSGREGGQLLRPYPRRSAQTTVKERASRGATDRHIKCVCGKPCSRRTGGPEPRWRKKMLASSPWTSTASNSSNVVVGLGHYVSPSQSLGRLTTRQVRLGFGRHGARSQTAPHPPVATAAMRGNLAAYAHVLFELAARIAAPPARDRLAGLLRAADCFPQGGPSVDIC
jgi:hypothetical protein